MHARAVITDLKIRVTMPSHVQFNFIEAFGEAFRSHTGYEMRPDEIHPDVNCPYVVLSISTHDETKFQQFCIHFFETRQIEFHRKETLNET